MHADHGDNGLPPHSSLHPGAPAYGARGECQRLFHSTRWVWWQGQIGYLNPGHTWKSPGEVFFFFLILISGLHSQRFIWFGVSKPNTWLTWGTGGLLFRGLRATGHRRKVYVWARSRAVKLSCEHQCPHLHGGHCVHRSQIRGRRETDVLHRV